MAREPLTYSMRSYDGFDLKLSLIKENKSFEFKICDYTAATPFSTLIIRVPKNNDELCITIDQAEGKIVVQLMYITSSECIHFSDLWECTLNGESIDNNSKLVLDYVKEEMMSNIQEIYLYSRFLPIREIIT